MRVGKIIKIDTIIKIFESNIPLQQIFEQARSVNSILEESIMTQTIYADGIANITLVDGVVRYDLINVVSIEKDKSNLRTVASVAMSMSALLRTYEQLSGVINRMVEQGLLKKNEPMAPVSADVATSPKQ